MTLPKGPERSGTRTLATGPAPGHLEPALPEPNGARIIPARQEHIRVLICDDHEVYRLGLRALLAQAPDLVLVGEAQDPGQALMLAYEHDAHVVLIAQNLPGGASIELIRRLSPHLAGIVVLADSVDEGDLVDALRSGAKGYLMRRTPPQRILDSIRAVAQHETALDSRVAGQLVHYLDEISRTGSASGHPAHGQAWPATGMAADQPPAEEVPAISMLTARQCTVAALVAEGLSNAEIARRLYLSPATVKSHLTIILRRLNLRDRTQLAIMVNRGATLGSP